MAEGFITRRGGVAGTAAPSINFISSTFDSITFTITNNDVLTADIFWEIGDSTPDANTLSLAGGATSSNQVASGLDEETSYTIFAFANAEGKAGSQTSSIAQTTPEEPIAYTAATGGTTTEYNESGKRYKSHTFTSSDDFEVTTVGDAADDRNKVDYLIIAGGGGSGDARGGGGAGGYRTTNGTSGANSSAESKVTVTAQSYTVTIGSGGTAPANGTFATGQSGTNSSALGITSTGGGGGGGQTSPSAEVGLNGGSGGGGGTSSSGGTGTANQGTNGGAGQAGANGGGGGAGQAGQAAPNASTAGNGGNGLANTLRDGTSETRAGGGAGGGTSSGGTTSPGTGGTGGGGDSGFDGDNGVVNTGSGGGAAISPTTSTGSAGTNGNGGSGIVIIRYEIAPSA